MQFDFDTPYDRRGTGSIKWDKYAGRDVIPMWVADMDFRSPPAVLQALRERVEHGVFGYTVAPADVIDAVVVMCAERFDWHIQRDWLLWFPGLNTALTAVCRAFGEDQDQALVLPPIYPPLLLAAPRSRKRNVLSPLVLDGQRWVMDFAHMQEVLSPRTRLLLFCNPHNPVGRVYDERELTQVAEFCERNDLLICSDDVHCDLLLDPGLRHRPLARLLPELAPRTITLMAASKTYNLAGLHCAYAIVPDAAARQRLSTVMQGVVAYISPLSYAATRAAYRDCDAWHAALLDYLRDSYRQVLATIDACPGLQMTPMEATYLAWIDARQLPVADPAAFFEQAGVGLSDGREFGSPGYLRLNFACPRAQLTAALQRMVDAVVAL
ncbi:MAG: PatB family C-S lyase [Gammaproteobacteria bacterium]|nr:PatB family C-S lyase [Gammaproteobacteria bacterium]